MTAINCQQTRIETTHRILNGDLNEHGTLFGGRLLEAVDAEASVAAMRVAEPLWSRQPWITFSSSSRFTCRMP
jgi:Acyl-CoA hydrolase